MAHLRRETGAHGENFNEVEALDGEQDNDSDYDEDNFDDNRSSDAEMSEEGCPYEWIPLVLSSDQVSVEIDGLKSYAASAAAYECANLLHEIC